MCLALFNPVIYNIKSIIYLGERDGKQEKENIWSRSK
jgi:hypothetical protein